MESIQNFLDYLAGTIFGAIGSLLQGWGQALSPYLPDIGAAALVAFAFYVILLIAGGLVAILARNLVRAMMGLVLTLLGVAGLYLLLAAPLLAFMQLLIYVGAVCVLIFFAIMLTRNTPDGEEARWPSPGRLALAVLAALSLLGTIAPLLIWHVQKIPARLPQSLDSAYLGYHLLREDVLPFELISIILLAAMAGAVFLAFRRPGASPGGPGGQL
jgi:NADH-quinone oxidoreductase subunit J